MWILFWVVVIGCGEFVVVEGGMLFGVGGGGVGVSESEIKSRTCDMMRKTNTLLDFGIIVWNITH